MRTRWLRILSSCLCLLATLASSATRVEAQDLAAETDALFAEWDREDSPGCAVAVLRGGEVVYAQGYGSADLEHGVPITPETVFYIGSTSKQFVTVCIALLEEAGELSFDDEVREHIPELPSYDQPVTIRQLIHHTSGVRDYLELWHLAGRSYLDHTPEQAVLDLICRQEELNFEPGTRHLYSNSCYFLLAVLVERVTGQSLREFAREHVFEPLGMDKSRFHDDHEELIPDRAFSYEPRAGGGFSNQILRFDLVGSGGVYSTVLDLARWDRNFYDNLLGDGGPALLETMHTRGVLDDGKPIDYAFALMHGSYRGARTVGHGGALAGYRAQFVRFPEHDFSVVILCNLGSMNPGVLAQRVADLYLTDGLGGEAPEPAPAAGEERQYVTVGPDVLARYVGAYELIGQLLRIRLDDGVLTAIEADGTASGLSPESETRFFIEALGYTAVFEPSAAGTFDTIVVTAGGREFRGARVELPAVDLDELRALAGDYRSEELRVTYRLRVEGEALRVAVGYAPEYELVAGSGGVWKGGGASFTFERAESGAVRGFRLDGGRVKNLAFRKL